MREHCGTHGPSVTNTIFKPLVYVETNVFPHPSEFATRAPAGTRTEFN